MSLIGFENSPFNWVQFIFNVCRALIKHVIQMKILRKNKSRKYSRMVKLIFAADYESSVRIFFNLDTSIFVVSRGESWRVVESRGESWRVLVIRGERRVYSVTSPGETYA